MFDDCSWLPEKGVIFESSFSQSRFKSIGSVGNLVDNNDSQNLLAETLSGGRKRGQVQLIKFERKLDLSLLTAANLDGQVNVLDDAFALIGNLGTTGGATWAQGDFNDDGTVNVLGDAFILIGQLGQSVIPPASPQASLAGSLSLDAAFEGEDLLDDGLF